ncbi:uncharacterized protein LOC131427981 [Malaya genurostris]|uniref:uncharacterized protein LOC131427981 n=1 Tax=Malaya genurostris TaxID=325434 RepID=UPI0026F3A6F5|nr:uncharacterized protein LOC131427981 [Malaya genurostris]
MTSSKVVFGLLALVLIVQCRPNSDEELPLTAAEFHQEDIISWMELLRIAEESDDNESSQVSDNAKDAPELTDEDIESWMELLRTVVESAENESAQVPDNVIDAPVVCPPGQKPDHKGKCRDVWGRKTQEGAQTMEE